MSLPDHEIDEPDEAYCTIHDHSLPCPHCQDDEADRQHDEHKERKS